MIVPLFRVARRITFFSRHLFASPVASPARVYVCGATTPPRARVVVVGARARGGAERRAAAVFVQSLNCRTMLLLLPPRSGTNSSIAAPPLCELDVPPSPLAKMLATNLISDPVFFFPTFYTIREVTEWEDGMG